MRVVLKALLPVVAAAVLLVPEAAYAQFGSIAGSVRDESGGALPGVTVEVTSPALIEKVRATTTGDDGTYRITTLPVGTYTVTFTLPGFAQTRRANVQVSTEFTANVVASMKVGDVRETVDVIAEAPVVDVQNVGTRTVFTGEELRDLPTTRNPASLTHLVPGITATGTAFSNGNICSGGVGTWCSPSLIQFNSQTSINDGVSQLQGRLQVDGMVINSPSASTSITGISSAYVADIANAQEIVFSLSGSLGENETGGATINIVPRTGGNRYAGNFFTAYTQNKWFDRNNGTRTGAGQNLLEYDYDVSGAFGGPIVRDRLWFYSVARSQGKEQRLTQDIFYNKNEGIWGANYEPDRERTGGKSLAYENEYKNINLRLTVQASQKNKFNIFWDEQDSCQDPCYGTVSTTYSPEGMWSVQTWPNHLAQLTWTNPYTNKLLLEAGVSILQQHLDSTRHREFTHYQNIPRIVESGSTIGGTASTGSFNNGFSIESGSINGGIANMREFDSYRPRASASYITGNHNAKLGYEGGLYYEVANAHTNDLRLQYAYSTPAGPSFFNPTGCYNPANPSASTCGNTSLYYPEDPFNQNRRPVPSSATINVGPRKTDEHVWYHALYIQDQWTLNRFTLNGALRYDHSGSRFNSTTVGPDIYVPVGYTLPERDGVNFQDITPRWGVAWDVFGTGKTSVKWNMSKGLNAANIGGIYTAVNPAGRVQNTMSRNWQDNNGNRIVDCDWTNQASHNTFGDQCNAINSTTFQRFGRSPYDLDESGLAIGLTTSQCGQHNEDDAVPQVVKDYCNRGGTNLLEGWGARAYNWQFGLGIQHELLPRLSAEVTYNRRWQGNRTVTDTLNNGCDLYQDGSLTDDCMLAAFEHRYPDRHFYSIMAPLDPALPGGGGYMISGLDTQANPTGFPSIAATTYQLSGVEYVWRGVDTNFVLRARGGLRLSGGTSTSSTYADNCRNMVNGPLVQQWDDSDYECRINRPYQTNVRGTVTYTIPKVDVLLSSIFQYRPGSERSANYTYDRAEAIWAPDAAHRATYPCTVQGQLTQGCFGVNSATGSTNLLYPGQLYGEGIRLFDVKLAKNIRFAGKRVNFGLDIYNIFNSDAILNYNSTFNPQEFDANGVATSPPNPWGAATGLVSPRFTRFQVQFDF